MTTQSTDLLKMIDELKTANREFHKTAVEEAVSRKLRMHLVGRLSSVGGWLKEFSARPNQSSYNALNLSIAALGACVNLATELYKDVDVVNDVLEDAIALSEMVIDFHGSI